MSLHDDNFEPPTTAEILESNANEPTTAPPFRAYTFNEIMDEPPKQWLVSGFIGKDDKVLIYGHGKIGKSLVVFDLIGALVMGYCKFAETFDVGEPVNVTYATGEGQSGISSRAQALDTKWNFCQESRDRIHILKRIPQLFDSGSPASIREFTRWYQSEFSNRLRGGVLILDTLARASAGADENSAKDTTLMLDALGEAAEMLGCTIIVVHHANKAGAGSHGADIRGSSNLLAGFDNAIYIRKSEGQHVMGSDIAKDSGQVDDLCFSINVHSWTGDDGIEHKAGNIIWTGTKPRKGDVGKDVQADIVAALRLHARGPEKALSVSALDSKFEVHTSKQTLTKYLNMLRLLETSLVMGELRQVTDSKGKPNRDAWHYWWDADREATND